MQAIFGGIGNNFSNLNGIISFGNLDNTNHLNNFGDGNGSALGFTHSGTNQNNGGNNTTGHWHTIITISIRKTT